jgi:predicted GNAT family acetyltransferase
MIIIDHTEVSSTLRGTGAGKKMVEAAVAWARREGVKIIPLCPFAASVFAKDPSLSDVLSS